MPNKCFTTFSINYITVALLLLLLLLLNRILRLCCMVNQYIAIVRNDTFSKHGDLRRSAVLDLRFAFKHSFRPILGLNTHQRTLRLC